MLISVPSLSFSQEMPKFDLIKTSKGDLEMHFVGHGTLMFKFNGTVIHIDPVSTYADYSTMPKADLVLVSHEHGDHFDAKALDAVKKESTKFYTIKAVADKVAWAETVKAGDILAPNGDFSVEIVPAYNIVNVRAPGQPYHQKDNGVGFVFTFGDTRVYVAGDTENTPEMKALKNIDVAFLPMNLPYTMTPEMVADAAKAFKPAILYPYHFGETDTNQLVQLLKDSGVEVRIRALK